MLIRREVVTGDAADVRAVTAAAFGRSVEATLVDELRASSAWLPALSLVALDAAGDALDEPLVALLGSPAYYARFGFRLSGEHGIEPPRPEWRPHFQVRVLTAYRPALRGTFTYPEPFDRT